MQHSYLSFTLETWATFITSLPEDKVAEIQLDAVLGQLCTPALFRSMNDKLKLMVLKEALGDESPLVQLIMKCVVSTL